MLTLVTWNLDGLEPRHLDVRTEAACLHLLLRPDPPDIVAVQEVVDRSWHAHLLPHFGHAGYTALHGRTDSEYYNAVFVRQPLVVRDAKLHRVPSAMGRVLLDVSVGWGEHELRVVTGHLESLRSSADLRKLQLAYAVDRLLEHPGPAVFAGDTNLRDAELPGVPRLGEVVDAWEAAGSPPAHRFTWDPNRVPNRRPGGRARMRFDRVYLKGLRTTGFRLVGEQPLPEADGWLPSDHLGVQVTLAL